MAMSRASANTGNRPFARNCFLWVVLLWLGQLPAFADQSVTLTWNPSPDTNAVGYKIYYGGTSGVYTNTVNVGSATTATVGGLTAGATYYFSATTVSASGAESAFSNEANYVIPLVDTNAPTGGTSQPPTLDPMANLTIYQNAGLQTVNLTGISSGSAVGNPLVISATSSDGTIIPTPTVSFNSPSTGSGILTFTPVANALGMVTVTVTVDNGSASGNLTNQMFTVTVVPVPVPNQPPTLDAITNLTIYQNAGLQTVNLTGITAGTSGSPTVNVYAVSSDNGAIISTPTVNYTNSNSTGTLTFTPVPNASGTATVTVTVDNGGASNNPTSQVFTVTVLPVPVVIQPPTLNAITNLTIYENAGIQTVALTGITSGSTNGNQLVTIWAYTSDSTIVPAPTVNYTNAYSTGTLTFAPVTNALGTATVTVKVNNGAANFSQTFTVTVVPAPPGNTTASVPAGNQPTLSPIANLSLVEGTMSETITLTGIGSGSTSQKSLLRVTATSSNPKIVSTPLVRYSNPASTAQLTLRPTVNAVGTSTITVTVNNGGKSNNIISQSFTVTLVPNQPPTLNPIANVTILRDAGSQDITLTGITSGSPAQTHVLQVRVTSSNPHLIFLPTIKYTSPATNALLTFKPTVNSIGVATLTVTVNNGGRNNNIFTQHFTVTVTPPATNIVSTANVGSSSSAGQDVAAALTTLGQSQGQFSFQVTGVPGAKYVVQATSDLIHWTSVQTNTSPFTFQDTTAGSGQKFYRAFYLQ